MTNIKMYIESFLEDSELKSKILMITIILILFTMIINIVGISVKSNKYQNNFYKKPETINSEKQVTSVEKFNRATVSLNSFKENYTNEEVNNLYKDIDEAIINSEIYSDILPNSETIYYLKDKIEEVGVDSFAGYIYTTESGQTFLSRVELDYKKGDDISVYFTKPLIDNYIVTYKIV